jgi:hypothetical protein
MNRLATTLCLVALSGSGAWAGPPTYRLLDTRAVDDPEPERPHKVLVVGISDDREIRHRFEDKLVSHLASRSMAAKTSYSFVPDLTALPDRERILEVLDREQLDAVITVRAVRLDEIDEATWAARWKDWLDGTSGPRELIRETIPTAEKPGKRYGIEVALWDVEPARRLWAGRSDAHTRKELRSGVGDILGLVMNALRDAQLL